ncbi:6-bladed beta-propeller [Chitinophaga silvatica]|uniref:6-bladed beta-propeller n=1 Tax=Chitinophaga silvatica TaxID=2282649 RepID=A0A3E1Y417_9BACT|nr:6-bladed beta-propeller [Chitinophaga silvatica]RFS19419.1 6-bladed beta-propeller [Chitinophaga silvatica]
MLQNPFLRGLLVMAIFTYGLSSCSSDNSFKDGQIIIRNIQQLPIDTVAQSIPFTQVADSISYVKLAPTQLPVGKIEKIKYADNKLLVLDTRVSRALFVFSDSGNFLYKIDGEKGQSITDFCIDSSHTNLYVYYANKHQISAYSFKSGELINTIRIQGFFHNVDILGDDVFVLSRDGITKFENEPKKYNQNRICMFDKSGTYLKGYMNSPIFPYINYGKMYTVANNAGTAISIVRLYSDTIYAITKNSMEAKFNLSLSRKTDLREFYHSQKAQEANQFLQSGNFSGIWGPFFQTSQNIVFYYTYQSRVYLYWKSLTRGSQFTISYFTNNIDGIPDMGSIKQINQYEAIAVLLPLDILNANRATIMAKSPTPNHKLASLAEGLSDYSNPVIAIYHLKSAPKQILANK